MAVSASDRTTVSDLREIIVFPPNVSFTLEVRTLDGAAVTAAPALIPEPEGSIMASVTSVTASPSTIAPHGGTSVLTPVVIDAGSTFTGTVYDDAGGSATVSVAIAAEGLTFTTNAANKGVAGYIYCVLSSGAAATVAVGSNGTSFVVTAT